MGKGNNEKYNRKELEKVITKLGFLPTTLGKGDHVVWEHEIYKALKLTIPTHRDLGENVMSVLCSNIIITMKVLNMDTSIFKHKEGIEGKLMKTVKNAEDDVRTLFTSIITRKVLGLNDDKDILEYIEKAKQKVKANDKTIKR